MTRQAAHLPLRLHFSVPSRNSALSRVHGYEDSQPKQHCAVSNSFGRMHRASLFVALSALAAPATAYAPLPKLGNDKPWTPAVDTSTADHPNHLAWSHKPTDAPRPRYGEMELLRRDFSMGTDTCGFFSGYSCTSQSTLPDLGQQILMVTELHSYTSDLRQAVGLLYPRWRRKHGLLHWRLLVVHRDHVLGLLGFLGFTKGSLRR